jgi:hypothetical protein
MLGLARWKRSRPLGRQSSTLVRFTLSRADQIASGAASGEEEAALLSLLGSPGIGANYQHRSCAWDKS